MNILINIVILLLFVFVSCENIIVTKRVVKDNILPENELDLCDEEIDGGTDEVNANENESESEELNDDENINSDENLNNDEKLNDEINKYSIKISQSGNGTVDLSSYKEFYEENENIFVSAKGNDGWMFVSWKNLETNEIFYDSEFYLIMDKDYEIEFSFVQREWTYFVYMAADNNLESAAIQDMNELEGVNLYGEPISIIVLLDRSDGYDSTNENWTGTRLYEIKSDIDGVNGKIISKQLDCGELDLSLKYETELDMGNKNTLKGFLDYGKNNFPSNNYGLIIWGHGTGWRSDNTGFENYKAVAIDENAESFMCISELNDVIEDMNINILCFDVCFGSLIEIAYEFKDSVNYIVGSASMVPMNGWDYRDLFARFLYEKNYDEDNFVENIVKHFKIQYQSDERVGITVLKTEYVERLFNAFEKFSEKICGYIISAEERDFILDLIDKEVEKYFCGSYPCDVFLDVKSFCQVMYENINIEWNNIYDELIDSINLVCKFGWSKNGNAEQLGIYFVTMDYENEIVPIFSDGYIKNSGDDLQGKFVQDSQWYVPELNGTKSFLDKLFSVKYY